MKDLLETLAAFIGLAVVVVPLLVSWINKRFAASDPRNIPIRLFADDASADLAAAVRAELLAEGWTVRAAGAVEGAIPLVVAGNPAAMATTHGLDGGVIYATGRVEVPPGRWTLANSLVTIGPRTSELATSILRRRSAAR